MNSALKLNIQKIYILCFFHMFLIILPIIVPYWEKLGLSMQEIFILQSFFALMVFLLEVPSGYFADLWGRKNALLIGTAFEAIGFCALIFASDFVGFMIYEGLIAIALSFISGSDLALLYDSYVTDETNVGSEDKLIANHMLSKSVAEGAGALVCSLLILHSFELVIYSQAVVAFLPFLITCTLVEPPRQQLEQQHKQNFSRIFRHILLGNPLLRVTFIAMVGWGLSTFFAVWMFQKYWSEQSIPLVYFGILWAIFNFTVGIFAKIAPFCEKKFGPFLMFFIIGSLPVAGYLGMGFFSGWLGVSFGLCFQICRGFNHTILKNAFNKRVPSEFRATANSIHSFSFRFVFIFAGPLIGYFIDHSGLNSTLIYLGLFFVFVNIFIGAGLASELRKDINSAI